MNKKKIIAMIACFLLTAGVFSGCSSLAAKTAPKAVVSTKAITLRLADIQAVGYPTILGDNEFAKQVEAKTGGRIKVQVFPGGTLGDEKSSVEQLQFGAIDAIRVSIAPLAEFNKDIGVLALPYLFKDKDQMFRVLDGSIGDKIFASLDANSKIEGLAWLDAGARNFYNTKKDVKTPDDLKGLKIRVQESKPMMDMVKYLGASATPMATGDVYSALQTGVVDGAENNWPSYVSFNHYEVAKHITVDEHTRVPEMIAMSKLSWDKIAPADQKLIKEAAVAGAAVERTEWLKQSDAAMATAKAKGDVITLLDSNKAFQDKVQPMYTANPQWKDLYTAIENTK